MPGWIPECRPVATRGSYTDQNFLQKEITLMKIPVLVRMSTLLLIVAVWGPVRLAAQAEQGEPPKKDPCLQICGLGTPGGSIAYGSPPQDMNQDQPGFRLL